MKSLAAAALLLLAQQDSSLRVAWGSVQTVDPALAVLPQDVRVAEALFEGLGAAESKVDGAVVTFKLPDRKWSDGKPVRASDYRFAWMRCLRPSAGSPWAFRFRHIKNALAWNEGEGLSERLLLYENEGPAGRAEICATLAKSGTKRHLASLEAAIKVEKDEALKAILLVASQSVSKRDDVTESAVGIKASDDRTLTVTLELPHPGFAQLAATSPFLPVPEHVVAAHRDWIHPDHLVTNGAYSVERWTREGLVLARVRGSGPEKVGVASVNSIGEAWPLYERGTVDWIERHLVPPEKIESLIESGDLRSAAGSSVVFLRANPSLKGGLRKALALAVDRAPLAKRSGPGSEPTRTLAGGGESPERDLPAAMTALVVDHPDLKTPRLRLLAWKGTSGEEIARVLRPQLEEALALSVRIDLREGPAYHAAVAAADYELALASFSPEAGDPLGVLDLFPDGRTQGEKTLVESALAIPLIKEGEWFVAKPRVEAKPGAKFIDVRLKK